MRITLRPRQINTDTVNHITVAAASTRLMGRYGRKRQINNANTIRPMLPIAAPAASTPAACLPRLVPSSPLLSFRFLSCFSINVALAGRMAGNARNKPPKTGPACLAMIPAITGMTPPRRKRTPYSYHLVVRIVEGLRWILIRGYLSTMAHIPTATATHTRSKGRRRPDSPEACSLTVLARELTNIRRMP
jgi:hypothetical protein